MEFVEWDFKYDVVEEVIGTYLSRAPIAKVEEQML
jgi:hypothetical protein